MIQLENITKVYQTKVIETTALDNINIEVPEGEFLSIMGPSGCGKSTLLNIMGMIDEPTTGQVKVAGKLVGNYHSKATARFRNELPLIYRKVSGKQRRQMAEAALTQVGLSNRMKHFPSQLSGGQKQRVAIARAIVGQPRIILADEPTGNLDSAMGNEIMDILMRLNQEQGTTIVMVTHDETMARKTHRLVRLFDGQQVS
jgi:putative ABC transport system ATP-binding protein